MKVGIEGDGRLFNSIEEMRLAWEQEDLEFKKAQYWHWLLKETLEWFEFKIDRLETLYYDLKYGIKNIVKWLPIIWADRHWDSHYILVLIKKKLELMEKPFREDYIHVSAERHAKQMRVCIELLKRITEDNYHTTKNFIERNDIEDTRDKDIKEKNRAFIDALEHKYKGDPLMLDRLKAIKHSSAIMSAEKQTQADYNLLFRILHKNIRSWWN